MLSAIAKSFIFPFAKYLGRKINWHHLPCRNNKTFVIYSFIWCENICSTFLFISNTKLMCLYGALNTLILEMEQKRFCHGFWQKCPYNWFEMNKKKNDATFDGNKLFMTINLYTENRIIFLKMHHENFCEQRIRNFFLLTHHDNIIYMIYASIDVLTSNRNSVSRKFRTSQPFFFFFFSLTNTDADATDAYAACHFSIFLHPTIIQLHTKS